MENVTPGSVWRHHSGRLYMVLFLANEIEGTEEQRRKYPCAVVYRDMRNGNIFAAPRADWDRRMTEVFAE